MENPTPNFLHLDLLFESTEDCGFAGPKSFGVNLLAFTSYEFTLIVVPVVEEWAKLPRLIVMDPERKRLVEILRVTDYIKIEGQDLFLRLPPTK